MKLYVILSLLCVALCHDDDHDYHDQDHADHEHNEKICDHKDWREAHIVNTAENQQSCGSCWAFVTTGLLEARYAQVTGELVAFSDGYLIDCQYPYSGCAGGHAADALQTLEMTQFIPNAATYPWSGAYSGKCNQHTQGNPPAHTDSGNALKDVWVTYHRHISQSENQILEALQEHPIAVGYAVSNAIGSYDGSSVFEDRDCLAEAKGHSSLLVGYTNTSWILKQSWGANYGAEGYTYLKRGDSAIQCGMYKSAVDVQMIKRREIEYKNYGKMHSYSDGQAQCALLDAKTGRSGWTLAIIPTRMHLEEVKALHIKKWKAVSKGKKGNKDFDNFWIGLNLADEGASTWDDGFTDLGYCRYAKNQPSNKYRTVKMSKITGKWSTEKASVLMRLVCSRYVTCPTLRVYDIPNSESLVFGAGNAALAADANQEEGAAVEGATVTVTCKAGYHMHGAAEGSCTAGVWTLPECEDDEGHDDREMTL